MKGARINFGVPNSEYVLLADDDGVAVSLKNQDTDTEYIGGGGGGGLGELVYENEFTANVTSSSAETITSFYLPTGVFEEEAFYIAVISNQGDTSSGKFLQSFSPCGYSFDSMGGGSYYWTARKGSNGIYFYERSKDSSPYGIWVVFGSNTFTIKAAYSSIYSGTINSTFKIQMYKVADYI